MEDKLNITIRIAELRPFGMEITRDEEPYIRNAEFRLNKLWKDWKNRFPDKSSHEVLGMVAFQFAKAFYLQSQRLAMADKAIADFEKRLDKILLDVGELPDDLGSADI